MNAKQESMLTWNQQYSEMNPLIKLDWNLNDEPHLIESVHGPPYTGGPGQSAPVAPHLSAALYVSVCV